jgi:hypothetical protein
MTNIDSLKQAQSLIPIGQRSKNLAPNTQLVRNDQTVELVFHGQPIAVWTDIGFHLVKPEYFPNNKLSKTTVKRINKYCPTEMYVSSTNKGTFIFCNQIQIACFTE